MARQIIDCITFYDGLDVLEIRLNTLAPYVDRFVICESPFDMVGKSKPLLFDENRERFKQFNIKHLVVEDHEKHMSHEWEPYFYQLDYMMRGFDDVGIDSVILLSDFDEIPNMDEYNYGDQGAFRQQLYYYYLNVFSGTENWHGTIAINKRNLFSLSLYRKRRGGTRVIATGWHFSYISPVEDIVKKIEAFCHRELDTTEIKQKVAENKKNLKDPFGRSDRQFTVQMPSGPKWLLDNKDRYEHLFYKERSK